MSARETKRLIHYFALHNMFSIMSCEGALQLTMEYIMEKLIQSLFTSTLAAGRTNQLVSEVIPSTVFFLSGPNRLVRSYCPDTLPSILRFSQISNVTPQYRIKLSNVGNVGTF